MPQCGLHSHRPVEAKTLVGLLSLGTGSASAGAQLSCLGCAGEESARSNMGALRAAQLV